MEYILLGIVVIILIFYFKSKITQKENISFKKEQYKYVNSEKVSEILKREYDTMPIMNKGEFRVYCELQELIDSIPLNKSKFRVFPQIVLDCFIKQADRDIKFLRADFVIVDPRGFPIIVVEYQGKGHYKQQNYLERDRRKRLACEIAGIKLIEVPDDFGKRYLENVSMILQDNINQNSKSTL